MKRKEDNRKMMFSLKNITISQRTFLFFFIMNCAIITIFIIFLLFINNLNVISNNIISENITSIQAAYNVEESVLNLKGLKANYFLDGNSKWISEFDTNIKDFYFWYNKALDSAMTSEEKAILQRMMNEFRKYLQIHDVILNTAKTDRNLGIKILLNDSNATFRSIYNECENLIKKNEELISAYSQKAIGYLRQGQIIGYIIIGSFFVLSIFLAFVLAKSITDPLKQMTRYSEMILDYTFPESGKEHNEMNRFKKSFQHIINSLREKQKMLIEAERRAAIGEMAAGVSHELNNPVGIIYGFAERLLKKEGLDESQKKMAENIFSEAERCKHLLQEFLDFAKPVRLNLAGVSLNTLLDDVVSFFSLDENNRQIVFNLSLPAQNIEITADNYRLRQVLINLLLNAIDAVRKREQKEINVSMHINGDGYIITIRDNGEGINETDLEKIFKPFYTTKHKGMGLGLSISKDIIEKHNGKLTVESKYTQWTEFRIFLPKKT